MAFNVAVWYTKFASRLAGKEKYAFVFLSVCIVTYKDCQWICSYMFELHVDGHVCLFNSISETEAKDVHRSLKVAAGIFKNLKVGALLFLKLHKFISL